MRCSAHLVGYDSDQLAVVGGARVGRIAYPHAPDRAGNAPFGYVIE